MIWNVAPISAQPSITLSEYAILETNFGTRHFVGYNFGDMEGRVSTPITTWDREKMAGITRSGRVYKLIGDPHKNLDAFYVWDMYMRINGISDYTDVTETILGE